MIVKKIKTTSTIRGTINMNLQFHKELKNNIISLMGLNNKVYKKNIKEMQDNIFNNNKKYTSKVDKKLYTEYKSLFEHGRFYSDEYLLSNIINITPSEIQLQKIGYLLLEDVSPSISSDVQKDLDFQVLGGENYCFITKTNNKDYYILIPKSIYSKKKDDINSYWNKSYDLVKTFLGYQEGEHLPKFMVLRLKGIQSDTFIKNNKLKKNKNYTDEELNLALIKAVALMVRAKCDFKNIEHKFNYLCKIAQKEIVNISFMLQKTADDITKVENNILDNEGNNIGNSYGKKKKNDKMISYTNHLWK